MKQMTAVILGVLLIAAPAKAFARSPEKTDCPQPAQTTQAIEAFNTAPDVAARIREMEAQGWVPGGHYAVMVSSSCGVVGCNQTWLTGRLMTRTPGQVNPQTVSVQANVVINRPGGKVFRVELISTE